MKAGLGVIERPGPVLPLPLSSLVCDVMEGFQLLRHYKLGRGKKKRLALKFFRKGEYGLAIIQLFDFWSWLPSHTRQEKEIREALESIKNKDYNAITTDIIGLMYRLVEAYYRHLEDFARKFEEVRRGERSPSDLPLPNFGEVE